MAILYGVVARGTFVLSEFSAVTEKAPAIVRRILEKLSEAEHAESRLCFSQDRYIFYILRSDGLTFFCMVNDTFGSKLYSGKKEEKYRNYNHLFLLRKLMFL
ncbi:Vesicle-associated membrane protein [Forsythia ovata]|uniref:Vesicle-associated membrane protein n=1 Tax=Forsythia ovata TaxID=205694 RepID=A0ABD1PKZ6_9LAMI